MGECMSCVAPRQNDADDLPLAGLLLVIPKILDAEKDSGSAAYSMWETHVLQRGKYAGTAGPVQPGPRLQAHQQAGGGLHQGRVPQHGTAMPLPELRKPSERGSPAGWTGPKRASAPCSAAGARFPGTSAEGYSRRGACRFLKGRAAVSQEPAPAQPPLAAGEAPGRREWRGPSSCCGDRQRKAAHPAGGSGAAGQGPFLLCCQRQP